MAHNYHEDCDAPELEDINPDFYVSACCEGAVHVATNNSLICEECGLFCKADEDKTVDNFYKHLGA